MSRIKTIHKNRLSEKHHKLHGMRFGRLTVIGMLKDERWSNGEPKLLCLCDCGWKVLVRGNDLKNGRTASCGCTKGKYGNRKKASKSDIVLESKIKVLDDEMYFFQLLYRLDMSEKAFKNATTRQGRTIEDLYQERYLSKRSNENDQGTAIEEPQEVAE